MNSTPLQRVDAFLSLCRKSDDGLVDTGPECVWKLGGVVFAENELKQFCAIQKAKRTGYEFSDRLALPGGMVRPVPEPPLGRHAAARCLKAGFSGGQVLGRTFALSSRRFG